MQLVYNIFFGLLYFVIFTSFYSKYRQNDIMIPNTYILKKKIDHCRVKHQDLLYFSINRMIIFRFSRPNPRLRKQKLWKQLLL